MKKKFFTLLFAVAASYGTMSAESGTCGENLTWSLNNRVLSVNGTGAMDNYYYQSDYVDSNNDIRAPWFGYKIDTIIINEGVTKIGDYAFFRCGWLTINFLSNQPCELGVNVANNGEGGTKIVVDCEAIEAYHTAWDNYLVRYDGYNVGWREYHPFEIHGPKSPYTITKNDPSGGWISLTPDEWNLTACDETIQAEAYPEIGYYFSKWEDGKTENPRTFEVNSDITIPSAIFEPYTEGICGHNLTWKYNNHTLTIQGTGEMWCDSVFDRYCPEYKEEAMSWAGVANDITDVIISEGVTNIGSGVFYERCGNLKNIYIASTVKRIGYYSFGDCYNIETITCYGAQPPVVILDYGQYSSFPTDMQKSTIIYVPADYLDTYKSHDLWGLYDVRPMEAKSTETNNLNVTPAENMVEVAWPTVSGAATYELVIKDKSGNVICTLIFNANGQLTQIAFHAPTRNNTPQQTQAAGFSFTITSLESGTSYDLTITSKDSNGGTLDTKIVSFTTTGEPQGIEDVLSDQVQCIKVIREGQIYILRGDKINTLQGQEIK